MVNAETPGVDHFLATAVDDFAEVIINATSRSQQSESERVKVQKFAEDWLTSSMPEDLMKVGVNFRKVCSGATPKRIGPR